MKQNEVVASVAGYPVTKLDITIELALEALEGMKESDPCRALQRVIGDILIMNEITDIDFPSVTEKTNRELETLKRELGEKAWREFLALLDLAENDLHRLILKRKVIAEYLEERFGLFSLPSEEDIKKRYEENPIWKFTPYEKARSRIAEKLYRENLERKRAALVEALRRRYPVKILSPEFSTNRECKAEPPILLLPKQ